MNPTTELALWSTQMVIPFPVLLTLTSTKPNPNQIMVPGSKPGMNGAAGFQKGLSCESCHSK